METPPATPCSSTPLTLPFDQRLIVVSNRLPVTLKRGSDGKYEFKESSGGLATGISGVKRDNQMLWYGWPGLEIPKSEEPEIAQSLRQHHGAIPNEWQAYRKVNKAFADKLVEEVDEGDVVWVHDYHLMLLPTMLYEAAADRGKQLTIGFFLHTPFPTADMFKVVPHWEELIEGVLRCRLIGFHTQAYAQNFKRMCGDYLGFKQFPSGIQRDGNFIDLGVYPIGIDVPKFVEHVQKPDVDERVEKFRSRYRVSKLIIGVDRLDYIKGIPQKLKALESILDRNPSWVGLVTMIQVAVPSRETVKDYKALADELHRQVDRLNTKYGEFLRAL
ncbi:Trehalose-6-P synthase/phosphatase complex synthase subunit [Exophiala oligosperma]